jgi:hemerythrin
VNYTRDHFAAEESMMGATNFPALATHQLKHRELTKQVEEFVGRFEKGDITLSVQLLNFLSDWLTNHIKGEDQKYGPWLNEHGIK